MSVATTPREILSISIEDAACAVIRLREFIALLHHHEADAKLRRFLIDEVEGAAEIVQMRVDRIGEDLPQ